MSPTIFCRQCRPRHGSDAAWREYETAVDAWRDLSQQSWNLLDYQAQSRWLQPAERKAVRRRLDLLSRDFRRAGRAMVDARIRALGAFTVRGYLIREGQMGDWFLSLSRYHDSSGISVEPDPGPCVCVPPKGPWRTLAVYRSRKDAVRAAMAAPPSNARDADRDKAFPDSVTRRVTPADTLRHV